MPPRERNVANEAGSKTVCLGSCVRARTAAFERYERSVVGNLPQKGVQSEWPGVQS